MTNKPRGSNLFISCDGLSLQHGLTTPNRAERAVKRAMIERARPGGRNRRPVQVRQRVEMFGFADFEELDILITDTRVDPGALAALEERGLVVYRA